MWWNILAYSVAFIHFGLAVAVTVHAVLWKRDSRAVIAWVGLAWLATIFGPLAYICFGVNRLRRKAASLQLRDSWEGQDVLELTRAELEQISEFSKLYPNMVGLAALGRQLTGRPVVPGNHIIPLVNGDAAFPAMTEAIGRAEKSVALLSYIFDSDRAGEAFLQSLVTARNRGVEVRVLIDDVGSRYSRPNMVRRLKEAGIDAASFLPTWIPRLPKYANLRNHRKILVVDGRIGFTGGTNIRQEHCLSLNPKFPVQCLHFRLEGPVVEQLQEAFAIDWSFASGETLSGDDWFPGMERSGAVWARGIAHGPDEDFETMPDVIAGAIASARERIRVVTPYFLPNASLIHALNVAALRGLQVEIFLPSNNNIRLVDWAATAQLWQLLQKGCRVYYTAPPFDHTKLMIVDDIWALIGSTNWDPRSLRLNFEFNVECYSDQLADELNKIVDQKAQSARPITLEHVNGRSLPVRLRDGLARLFSPYL